MQADMPELPGPARQRYQDAGLTLKEVLALTDDMGTAGYYDATVAAGAPAKTAANWVLGDLTAHCKVMYALQQARLAAYPMLRSC